jgi:hypothetical protein
MPPLARQIASCLLDFGKKMNLSWTSYGDDTFEPDFKAQASAFDHLAKGIEDAMDEIPDNNRIFGKLVIVDANEVEPMVSYRDVASDSLLERFVR